MVLIGVPIVAADWLLPTEYQQTLLLRWLYGCYPAQNLVNFGLLWCSPLLFTLATLHISLRAPRRFLLRFFQVISRAKRHHIKRYFTHFTRQYHRRYVTIYHSCLRTGKRRNLPKLEDLFSKKYQYAQLYWGFIKQGLMQTQLLETNLFTKTQVDF